MKPALSFLLPLALGAAAFAQTGQNVNHALAGTATQSADHPTYPTATASRLIDGNRNGVFADGSCNVTAVMAQPWWQVALAGPRLVHEVVIYPRADANNTNCRDLLVELKSGSNVLWSQTCGTGGAYPARGVALRLLAPPGGITCDTVRLSRPSVTNEAISLAEVEVLQIAPITPVNWAIYGTATQIATEGGYTANLAIDGNTDGRLANNSTAATAFSSTYSDWWQVVLPRRPYDEVRLWPSSHHALYTLYIQTFDGATLVSTNVAMNPPSTGPFIQLLNSGQPIDRVRISRNSQLSPILLAEVEVLNYSVLDSNVQPFGLGCAGSAGTPVLRQTSSSSLGANFSVELRGVPASSNAAFLVTGFSRTLLYGALPLPFDLGVLGAGGCQLYSNIDLTQVLGASGGIATSSVPIPSLGYIQGADIYQQALVIDPATNALGLTVSNALRARIGF